MNYILSGFMGSGKTTVAKALAQKLGLPMVDLDEIIEKTAQKSISRIFAEDGESCFRKMESEAASLFTEDKNTVVATGGGTLLNSANVSSLKTHGRIIFLDVTIDTILGRIKPDGTRPLLEKASRQAVEDLLMGRLPIYTLAADVTIDANSGTPEEIAEKILQKLSLTNPDRYGKL